MTSHRVVLASLIVVCFGSVALAQNVVYTGCLKSADGSLYSVRAGTSPMQPCKAKDKQISWNMAGQPGPPGPPGPSLPGWLEVNVNCDEGQTISAALAQQAEKLTVSISGTCAESVDITRDDVILQGVGINPTIMPPAGEGIRILGAQRVNLQGFALKANTGAAIWAGDAASFQAHLLKISNPGGSGIDMQGGVTANVNDSEISGNGGDGVRLFGGSSVSLNYTQITDNGGIGVFVQTSVLHLWGGTNVARNERGVVIRNSHVLVQGGGCTILDNRNDGLQVMGGSNLLLEQCRVAGNGGRGLGVSQTSSAVLADVIVQNNGMGGVWATSGSDINVGGASTIDGGKEVSGIVLEDTCTSNAPGTSSITGFPYGIECGEAEPPSVAQIRGQVPVTLSTNCPHI